MASALGATPGHGDGFNNVDFGVPVSGRYHVKTSVQAVRLD